MKKKAKIFFFEVLDVYTEKEAILKVFEEYVEKKRIPEDYLTYLHMYCDEWLEDYKKGLI